MKKHLSNIMLALALSLVAITLPSCATKSGCPMNENVHSKPDRKGKLSKKGGNSNLFPKDMRRY